MRQARSSETRQRGSHAGVRDSRPCLVKDAAAIMREKGQAGRRALLDLKDVLHILLSQKKKASKRGNIKEWKTYQGNETAQLNQHAVAERISKLRKKNCNGRNSPMVFGSRSSRLRKLHYPLPPRTKLSPRDEGPLAPPHLPWPIRPPLVPSVSSSHFVSIRAAAVRSCEV